MQSQKELAAIKRQQKQERVERQRNERREQRASQRDPWKDVKPTPSYHEDEKGRIHVHRFTKDTGSMYIPGPTMESLFSNNPKNNRRELKKTRNKRMVNTRPMNIQRIPREVKIPVKIKGEKDGIMKVKLNSYIKVLHTKIA